MKIAILSDIHGNYAALKSVIKQIDKIKIDHIFVLGDQLGYYYQAEKVYNILENYSCFMIAGNHEKLYLEYLEGDDIFKNNLNIKYGKCFEFYSKSFSSDLNLKIRLLKNSLKITLDNFTFLLCHGSFDQSDRYIYPDENKNNICDIKDVDFIFNGHTHYPMFYKGKYSTLINVGSVGQSRTVGGIANWGVFNTKNGVFSPHNTPYDINEVILSLKKNKATNQYLFNILKRNNI